jgi:hypothetical protein
LSPVDEELLPAPTVARGVASVKSIAVLVRTGVPG